MNTVVLINPFKVPAGQEEVALRFWEQAAEYMRQQPRFIATRLHKTLTPDARFTYVNIAEWESAERFQTAISREEFERLTEGQPRAVPTLPNAFHEFRKKINHGFALDVRDKGVAFQVLIERPRNTGPQSMGLGFGCTPAAARFKLWLTPAQGTSRARSENHAWILALGAF